MLRVGVPRYCLMLLVSACAATHAATPAAPAAKNDDDLAQISEDVLVYDVAEHDDIVRVIVQGKHAVSFLGECVGDNLLPDGHPCVDNAVRVHDLPAQILGKSSFSTRFELADRSMESHAGGLRRFSHANPARSSASVRVIHEWKRAAREIPLEMSQAAKPRGCLIRGLEIGYSAKLTLTLRGEDLTVSAGAAVPMATIESWIDQNKVSVEVNCDSRASPRLCDGVTQGALLRTSTELDNVARRFDAKANAFARVLGDRPLQADSLAVLGYEVRCVP